LLQEVSAILLTYLLTYITHGKGLTMRERVKLKIDIRQFTTMFTTLLRQLLQKRLKTLLKSYVVLVIYLSRTSIALQDSTSKVGYSRKCF